MSKLKHMDFVLEKNEHSCIKFRFYPRLSILHRFNFNDCYSFLYSWGILESKRNHYSNESGYSSFERVFFFRYDEDGALRTLDRVIRFVIDCKLQDKNVQKVENKNVQLS